MFKIIYPKRIKDNSLNTEHQQQKCKRAYKKQLLWLACVHNV